MTSEELKKMIAADEGETMDVKETSGQRSEMVLANVVQSMRTTGEQR